jgi:hypothetical protein
MPTDAQVEAARAMRRWIDSQIAQATDANTSNMYSWARVTTPDDGTVLVRCAEVAPARDGLGRCYAEQIALRADPVSRISIRNGGYTAVVYLPGPAR